MNKKPDLLIIAVILIFAVTACSHAGNEGNVASENPVVESIDSQLAKDAGGPNAEDVSESNRDNVPPADSWKVSAPEEQGMDSNKLAACDQEIIEKYQDIHSLLVARHGYITFEKYYQGHDQYGIHNVKSVTKSVMSALVGIALEQNLIDSVEQSVSDFYPEYFKSIAEPLKKEIKIKHLLTMSAGLEFEENGPSAFSCWSSSDWIGAILDLPQVNKPGEVFNYNSGLAHLLSGIITRASEMSTLEFGNKYLFSTLGITIERWDADPKGYYFGGSELYLTPRDMAKIGYLYLNNGNWYGKQVIPEEWVRESFIARYEGLSMLNEGYGYLWWIRNIGGTDVFYALGYGGQYIFIIPDLDMVVAVTMSISSSSSLAAYDLLESYIMDSVFIR